MLNSLKTFSPNMTFSNRGSVMLDSMEVLPEYTTFSNGGGDVDLDSLKKFSKGLKFNNKGKIHVPSMGKKGKFLEDLKIEDLILQDILNCMIKQIY